MRRAIVVAILLCSTRALAVPAYTNNGAPVKWPTQQTLWIKQSQIPYGSYADQAIAGALTRWAGTIWIINRVEHDGGYYDTPPTVGNGMNEIGLVDPSMLDNGVLGVTYLRHSGGQIIEGDIMLSNALNFVDDDERLRAGRNNGRAVAAHEIGHFMGLGHDAGFTIMRSPTPVPLVGLEISNVFSQDAYAIAQIYGGQWQGWAPYDYWASSQALVPGSGQLVNFDGGWTGTVRTVCRGDAIEAHWSIGNRGWLGNVLFLARVYMTGLAPDAGGDAIYDRSAGTDYSDVTAATFQAGLAPYESRPVTVDFKIPMGLPIGYYYTYLQLDFDGRGHDRDPYNNSAVDNVLTYVHDCPTDPKPTGGPIP